MPKTHVYKATGFMLLSNVQPGGLRRYPVAATINIADGDAIFDNGAGYATNANTAMAATFLGIAVTAQDNTSGIAGALYVQVVPPESHYQFIVPVEENAVITQTAVGTIVDLQSNNTIDINDTSITAGPGFFIDEIDAGTKAVAANTYGYAIGHFAYVS
jgi:hypothetical protein